jgi:hypothetical protein
VQNLELQHGIGFFIGLLVGKNYAAGAGAAPRKYGVGMWECKICAASEND